MAIVALLINALWPTVFSAGVSGKPPAEMLAFCGAAPGDRSPVDNGAPVFPHRCCAPCLAATVGLPPTAHPGLGISRVAVVAELQSAFVAGVPRRFAYLAAQPRAPPA